LYFVPNKLHFVLSTFTATHFSDTNLFLPR